MKKVSTYEFLKALNQKIPKKVVEQEYNRIYKNLVRSVKGYAKKGFDVLFFDIPDRPKKITEGSLRKLKNAVNEWKYYTGRPDVDVSKLGKNVQKTGKFAERNIGSKVGRDIAKKRQQTRAIEELIEKNKDNPYYREAVKAGYNISDLPNDTDNLAIKMYEIAEEALDSGDGKTSRQQALFSVVGKKAELSIQRFNDMGVLDTELSKVYSFNLSLIDFESLAMAFEAWLWASDQYTNIDTTPLEQLCSAMRTNHNNMSFEDIKAYAQYDEEYYE